MDIFHLEMSEELQKVRIIGEVQPVFEAILSLPFHHTPLINY